MNAFDAVEPQICLGKGREPEKDREIAFQRAGREQGIVSRMRKVKGEAGAFARLYCARKAWKTPGFVRHRLEVALTVDLGKPLRL